MENEEIVEVLKSIDRKMALLVSDVVKRTTSSVHEQVNELSKLKMSNPEIAQILGISPAHVATQKSIAKKKKGKKK